MSDSPQPNEHLTNNGFQTRLYNIKDSNGINIFNDLMGVLFLGTISLILLFQLASLNKRYQKLLIEHYSGQK